MFFFKIFLNVPFWVGLLFVLNLPCVQASNTGGVPTPSLRAYGKATEYRLGFSPSEEGTNAQWLHRFQYQQSFSEQSRWRILTQLRDVNNQFEYDELRVQYLWLAKQNPNSHRESAYRIDLRTRKGERPEQLAFIYTNRWHLLDNLALTGVVIGNWQFGGNANPGTRIETRASLVYKLADQQSVAIEMFNDYGDISEQSGFSRHRHSIGVMYTKKINHFQLSIGYQSGLTPSTPQHTLRLWFTKNLTSGANS
jgi:hypothetical protein